MIHAYDEDYLEDAMDNLACSFDYVANDLKVDLDLYLSMFIASGVAKLFGDGNPAYVAGRSGAELVQTVYRKSGIDRDLPEPTVYLDRSPEYWCGMVLAYFQWYTARQFSQISKEIRCSEIVKLYHPLHEASIQKTCDVLIERTRQEPEMTRLARLRKYAGMSQAYLAKASGVSLRSIQMYEQRNKDINHASAETVYRLSRAIGCGYEDLLEF